MRLVVVLSKWVLLVHPCVHLYNAVSHVPCATANASVRLQAVFCMFVLLLL